MDIQNTLCRWSCSIGGQARPLYLHTVSHIPFPNSFSFHISAFQPSFGFCPVTTYLSHISTRTSHSPSTFSHGYSTYIGTHAWIFVSLISFLTPTRSTSNCSLLHPRPLVNSATLNPSKEVTIFSCDHMPISFMCLSCADVSTGFRAKTRRGVWGRAKCGELTFGHLFVGHL